MERMAKWRRHSLEFKRQVVERMKSCPNITELARELQLERKLLYIWKGQLEGRPEPRHANLGLTTEDRRETQLREEITKLKLSLADRTLENDFFKHALLRVREGRQPNTPPGAAASTTPSARGSKSKAR
jgi:transposase-like protein